MAKRLPEAIATAITHHPHHSSPNFLQKSKSMKTRETETRSHHQSPAKSEKPFFGASSERVFFSAERGQPTPFFQPKAVSPSTIQAKSDTSEAEGISQPVVQRMPAFESEVTANGEVQRKLINSPQQSSASQIQAKLTIGEPGDKYEQEADRVASQVVGQIHAPASAQSTQGLSVQRQEEKKEELQTKPEITPLQRQEEKKEELQTKPEITALQRQEEKKEELQAKPEMTALQQQKESRTPNQTGLPNNLKAGVENLSGYSLDDVRVHYNSPKPAQLQALAYTQGTEIHVAPGQEKHLPHEAWHVVQQMQGRVKPTMQMKGVQINDDEGLEKEADAMGTQVAQSNIEARREKQYLYKKSNSFVHSLKTNQTQNVIQRVMAYRVEYPNYKIQIEGNKIIGFKGNPDGKGINISFILPDHSSHFASERNESQLKGLRLVTFEIDDHLWEVIQWKATQKGQKKNLKTKWLNEVENFKNPSWSDGSNLTKFIKQTALGFEDRWLDVLKKGVKGTATILYYGDLEDGLKEDDKVYAYLKNSESDGVCIELNEVEKQGYDKYMTVSKAMRLGYITEHQV